MPALDILHEWWLSTRTQAPYGGDCAKALVYLIKQEEMTTG
ncbi:hypothetical protein [Nitrosomonas communis]|nr:hypothetical protein [Nitrosomonas communis]